MKKARILLLICLLLCGCDAGDSGITNVSSLTPPTESSAVYAGLYAPDSEMERRTSGAVKAFPLDLENTYGIRTVGEDILVFSGTDATTLTLLTGDNLSAYATLPLEEYLSCEDPSLQISGNVISYYRESTRETVVLDRSLKEIGRILAPEGLSGKPILSGNRSILYYCTDKAIFAWDLEENLHRTLKELSYSRQHLAGLHMNDTVLRCRITDHDREETLLISTETGKLLHVHEGLLSLKDQGDRFYASFPNGMTQALVFGSQQEDTLRALIPEDLSAAGSFMAQANGAVTVSTPTEGSITLEYYDLSSGLRMTSLTLSEQQDPLALEDCADSLVYLLCYDPEFERNTLYRWDCSRQNIRDTAIYTGLHYTAGAPDLEGLERCRTYAAEIGERHGINVLIWKDAVAVQPWDYDLEPEYLVDVLMEELKALDQRLSLYPREMLADTASHFSSLSICLVRQLTGTAESGSLETATGIQFTEGTDAYVVLAVGELSDRTLYHELFHVMETHLLGNTPAFDRWDQLNPTGFRYDYSYESNKTRNSGVYLQNSSRAFVDTYSMSYPKEDRARIMEYAMLPGNRELFQTQTLQSKLKTLCQGIRDAYDLEKSEQTFLWEQYLD